MRTSDILATLESTEYGLFLLDDAGHVLVSNRGMSRIFGYSADELRGLETIEEIVAPAERPTIRRARERLVREFARSSGGVWRWVRRDGSFVDVEIAATAVQRDEGRRGLLVEVREVGEEMLLREEATSDREHAQRDHAAAALVSDLVTQLDRLRSLQETGRLMAVRPKDQRLLADALGQGAEILRLLRPLVRPESVPDAAVDPAAVAYRAFELTREVSGPEVSVNIRVNEAPPHLHMDRAALEEALSHLLLLVRQRVEARVAARRPGYHAAISFTIEPAVPPAHAPRPDAPHVVIAVDHNGEARSDAFDSELEVVRRRFADLGGVVVVGPGPVGERVSMFLPPVPLPAPAAAERPREVGEPARDGSPSLLLVNDDIHAHESVAAAFSAYGSNVTGVTTSEAAFRVMGERQFDLVLLAIELPDSTGWQTLARLRERESSAPVIMLGRFASEADARRAGAQGLVADPLNVRDLFGAVERALGRRLAAVSGR